MRLPKSEGYDSQHSPSIFGDRNDGILKINNHFDVREQSDLQNIKIEQILPHIFKRPYLSVSHDALFFQIGTFLATGSRIYVDALLVKRGNKLEGKIGGYHILKKIMDMKYDEWSSLTAKDLMDHDTTSVEIDCSLNNILDYFAKTGFAIAPITDNGLLIGSIAIRDLLPLVSELNIDIPVKTIASPIVTISKTESIKNSIEIMLREKIRNLVIAESDDYGNFKNYIVNDRNILEYIFSEGRRIMRYENAEIVLNRISIESLITPVATILETQSVSKSASMLMDLSNPALLLKDHIITAWDVIMKTIGRE
jgi:predicted transcriptional regulator